MNEAITNLTLRHRVRWSELDSSDPVATEYEHGTDSLYSINDGAFLGLEKKTVVLQHAATGGCSFPSKIFHPPRKRFSKYSLPTFPHLL